MCGIAGIVTFASDVSVELAKACDIQKHRGPDSSGTHVERSGAWTVGLAHQRLSVQDLSSAGNQPMRSHSAKSWIVYNGEVYNFREIRKELEADGIAINSRSDTEVVLAALERWGLEKALNRFNGMWAFAWYDSVGRRLVLSRDRVGEKPLYYCMRDNVFYFASEAKAILEMTNEKFSLNSQVVGEYLHQSLHNTGVNSFFNGISKLPAGTYGVVPLDGDRCHLSITPYWVIPTTPREVLPEHKFTEQLRELFFDSVRLRLVSDVPVGLLLSGGVDSSAIAAAMKLALGNSANINALAAVSDGSVYDESKYIDIMAQHLGCSVHKVQLNVTSENALGYLEKVCWHNDEPVGSFSNVAHYLLMEQARLLGLTVILSGQGADELLCGYKKYLGFYIQSLMREHRYIRGAEVLMRFWLRGTVVNQFSFNEAKRYIPQCLLLPEIDISGERLKQFNPVSVGLLKGMSVEERQAADVTRFSVPALVHYEDRMSMAFSREIRVPFLDHRLIELLVPAPVEYKLHDGWTKYAFRKALDPYLPAEIAWRKDKQGFVNPQSEWLKKELRPFVREYFADASSLIFKSGFIDQNNLLKKYDQYCKQKPESGTISFKDIFNPLALEIWMRRYERYLNF